MDIYNKPTNSKRYVPFTSIHRINSPKERINIYRQHIRQLQYQQSAVEEHLRTCGDGKFHMFPFFKTFQENKSLRKSYEDYLIDKFKPLLNKKTSVAKLPKIAVLNMTSTSCLIPIQHQISKTK